MRTRAALGGASIVVMAFASGCHARNAAPAVPAPIDRAAIPPGRGAVFYTGNRIDAFFPRIAIERLGCGPPSSSLFRVRSSERRFAWGIQHAFARDSTGYPHFMATSIGVSLPRETAPTANRLDSAFRTTAIWVWEFGGPRGRLLDLVEPQLRAVYFIDGRLRFVIQGREAVEAFLRPARDSVILDWCEVGYPLRQMVVPLVPVATATAPHH